MNRALSDELKTTFFNIIPETRPFEGTWKITEGNWLAGFTSGEGCFSVKILNSSSYRQGSQVLMLFRRGN